jgi:transcriptional regulator with XRE-family HTH domain
MSQEELAHLAGIAVSQVGRIERGVLNPSISTLFAIARALEVEPKELFDFKEKLIRKSPDQKKKK